MRRTNTPESSLRSQLLLVSVILKTFAGTFSEWPAEVGNICFPLLLAFTHIPTMPNSHCSLNLNSLSIMQKCCYIWVITSSSSCTLLPKKDSRGSWLNRSDRRNRPGFCDRRYRAISTKEQTEWRKVNKCSVITLILLL